MNWLTAHRKALLLALRRLAAAPLNTLLAILALGIVLALPAGGYLVVEQIAAVGRATSATLRLTIFMAVDADREAALAIDARLKGRADVATTQFLAREETLARMKGNPALNEAIAVLPENPFPDAIIVTPAREEPAVLEKLAQEVRSWRHVEHVQSDNDWARKLASFIRLARTCVLLLAILFGIGLVSITFNTIRLQVLTRWAEIEVSRLLGANDAFIRRPYLWYGALIGLLGGVAAWLIIVGALIWLRGPVTELVNLYGITVEPAIQPLSGSALLLGIAAALGWLGAAFSLRRQLG